MPATGALQSVAVAVAHRAASVGPGHPPWLHSITRLFVFGDVVVKAKAERQVRTLEILWQRWVGRRSGDTAPGRTIQRYVARGEPQYHLLHTAIRIDAELDPHLSLFVQR